MPGCNLRWLHVRFSVVEMAPKHVFLFEFPRISHANHHCSILICDNPLMCDIRDEATHLWPLRWLLNRLKKFLSFHCDITEEGPFYRILHIKWRSIMLYIVSKICCVRISTRTTALLIDFRGFILSPFNQIPGYCPQLGHYCLLANPFQLISRPTERYSAAVVQILTSL